MPQDARSDGEPQPARVHEVAGGPEGSCQERRAVQVCGGSPHKCGRGGGRRHRAVQVCVWGRGVIVQPAPPPPHTCRCIADSRGVFVQPALYEAFGLTVIEAMASGLPTFATSRCGGGGEGEDIFFMLQLHQQLHCQEIMYYVEGCLFH